MGPVPDKKATRRRPRDLPRSDQDARPERDPLDEAVDRVFRGELADPLIAAIARAAKDALRARRDREAVP